MKTHETIRMLREAKGITQLNMAKALGISQSVVNRIELGTRSIRDNELLLIAQMLEVSTDYLLNLSNEDNKKKYPNLSDIDLLNIINQSEILFDGKIFQLNQKLRDKLRSAIEFSIWEQKNGKD